MGFVNDAWTRIRSGARIVSWTCELSWQLSVTALSDFVTLITGPIFSRVVMSCAKTDVKATQITISNKKHFIICVICGLVFEREPRGAQEPRIIPTLGPHDLHSQQRKRTLL